MAKKGKPDTGKTVKSVCCKISLWLRRVRKPKAYLSPGISAKGFMGEPTLATSREMTLLTRSGSQTGTLNHCV